MHCRLEQGGVGSEKFHSPETICPVLHVGVSRRAESESGDRAPVTGPKHLVVVGVVTNYLFCYGPVQSMHGARLLNFCRYNTTDQHVYCKVVRPVLSYRCVHSTTGADDAVSLPSTQPPSPTSVHELSGLEFFIYTIEYLAVNQAVLRPSKEAFGQPGRDLRWLSWSVAAAWPA
jgi:hypothetical protein